MNLTALTRRTKSITMASIAAAAILFGAGSAAAQTTDGPLVPGEISVTPFVGFGFSGDIDSATGVLGAAGGYNWSSKVAIEGELNFLPSPELNGIQEVDATVWSLTGNLLYHFAKRPFTPYAAVGIGFGHSGAELEGTTIESSSNEFVVNFGGGVERTISERLRFRGDLRYFFGGDLVPDYWRLAVGIKIVLPK